MALVKEIKREAHTLYVLRRALKWLDAVSPESDYIVPDEIESVIDQYGDNLAIHHGNMKVTYGALEHRANKIANWAQAAGLKAGDTVALFMENRPDYIATWFGLSKIGVVTGLINHNLTEAPLAHCINIAEAKLIITGAQQDDAIQNAQAHLNQDIPVWTMGGSYGEDLITALDDQPAERPDRALRGALLGANLCMLVYTSGTTGLPKAARLTHTKVQSMMRSFIGLCNIGPRDRIYDPLPLYHSTGGVCAVGAALLTGAGLIIRDKFSVSQYWDDVADKGATVFAYIGELCRYLVNAPSHPKERAHALRTGFGNGLRAEIWEEFLDRFDIPNIVEFYGATEGNVNLACFDGKVGACGRIPGWLKNRFDHVAFVKFDVETETVVRGEDGLCVRADVDEAGEVLGRIGAEARNRFEGYKDEEATEKKVLHNVFEQGDMWFRTGDLMKQDAEGYIYFVDRIGDTFRWKGENVATNEVSSVLSKVAGVEMANVYGVEVPGTDGKAGMAAITLKGPMDFSTLYQTLSASLPKYAVPLFIRVQEEAETTGTFKYRKVDLVADGFDPNQVDEPLWYYKPASGRYEPLTPAAFETIRSGAVRY